jgi:hypothetical protein
MEEHLADEIIKKCNCCLECFTAPQIVEDKYVVPIGVAYLETEETDSHFYFFQHNTEECGTSFTIDVEKFRELVSEPIPETVLRLKEGCEGHCVNIDDLSDCQSECHFAPFRRFLLKMLAEKKAIQAKQQVSAT